MAMLSCSLSRSSNLTIVEIMLVSTLIITSESPWNEGGLISKELEAIDDKIIDTDVDNNSKSLSK